MWPPAQGRLGPQKLGGRRLLPQYPHLELRVPASRTGRQPFLLLSTPVCGPLPWSPRGRSPCVCRISLRGAEPSQQGPWGQTAHRGGCYMDAVSFVYSKTHEIILNFK